LTDQHVVLAKDVRQVRWFIKACYAVAFAGKTTVAAVKEGKEIYMLLIASGVSWVVLVQFFHVVLPYLKNMTRYLPH
jgi:hypothetical protein